MFYQLNKIHKVDYLKLIFPLRIERVYGPRARAKGSWLNLKSPVFSSTHSRFTVRMQEQEVRLIKFIDNWLHGICVSIARTFEDEVVEL